jgi:hypothetical protein
VNQGFRVRLDLGPQVLGVDVLEDRGFGQESGSAESSISPTLTGLEGGIVSGSMLAQKAKQFDDGLYAATELAAQSGAGSFAGKAALLGEVARRATSNSDRPIPGNAVTTLLAACRLGKVRADEPPSIARQVDAAEREFLATPLRSKPLGFYTWTPELSRIYRQDRMLQTELEGSAGIARVAEALAASPGARATYESYLALVDRLTNPHGSLGDLRPALRAVEAGRPGEVTEKGVAVFPASRSHEADLVMKLYGNRPIPEGFSLVDEMVRRIRAGRLDLKPTAGSGWYDHQTWALEPLVIPEKMPEAARLRLGEPYRKQLVELFKGVLALTRETHVKQLEIPAPAEAPPSSKPPVTIYIGPELSAEPLVSYYRRRAESYEFIRKALLATFGREGLESMRRLSATGPVSTSLASELESMRALFSGASESAARQLGMPTNPSLDADVAAFREWARTAQADADVGRDARMMVPIFYDQARRKTKAWAFLGWSARPAVVSFAVEPSVEVFRDGRKVEGKDAPRVVLVSSFPSLAYPVTAEVYVDELLDRDQFRRLCDRYKTRKAILEHLK